MDKKCHIWIFLLRLGMGWLFLYAGLSKVLDPQWTAKGYLETAKTFPSLFSWLTQPGQLAWVDPLNKWGLTLIGIALISGALVRYASAAGALLMVLYYLPALDFPYAGTHSFLVDEHVIYFLIFLFFIECNAGTYWGADGEIAKVRNY